ncbi:sensor histidine kinase [Streptosporangium subroseum]|uniref:sensor histidine kinase n=1 Tax=Streptosporangium subroseum TaxID=106412 RepID=UPI003091DFAB|nr:ATP-binding protein [Streptosporangium subroseum]
MSTTAPSARPTPQPRGPTPPPASRRSADLARWARWTTRQWLRIGVTSSLLVLALLAVVGALVLGRMTTISDQLVDHSSPALTAAARLETALVNQETGIRGYGVSGNQVFLEPYRQGLTQQRQAEQQLQALAGDRTSQEDLRLVAERARAWQEGFAAKVAAAPAGQQIVVTREDAEAGKAVFDDLRQALTAQQQHLQTSRDDSREALMAATSLRNGVFSAIALLIVALAVLISVALRRAVTGPLERLSAGARNVAGGDFSHPIVGSGPADLRALSQDVEAMRCRLAEELTHSEQARTRLDEQAAELRRSNTELEQFAYVASHDLQEPLRKVTAFCQLLERNYGSSLDDRARQYIGFAVDGAARMQTLINDLLDFSRVGRLHHQHTTVDLEAVFTDTAEALSLAIAESEAHLSHDRLPTLTGDKTQLGMLVHNLLSNAIKFRSPDRPCRIHLAVRREEQVWRFTLTDNGIGIEPEYAERVFVIFQRLHTRQAYPGNGIGLALCKKIVEFHGGLIALDPDPLATEPGTRITFTLPARPDDTGESAQ